jgi:low temperature requirement protein LtrA
VTGAATTTIRHLRPRGAGAAQPTTTVELFFDLVYVFAVTQLSHQILDDLSVAGVARAAFLLLVVWWAWIGTTWMANWFDPGSSAVRAVLTAVMLASLLMAAAVPGALAGDGVLFAASYVTLQVGRNAAAALLLPRGHPLRDVFERLVVWSVASGVLWLAGGVVDSEQRLALWLPALALELAAPAAGYWRPGRGRAATTDYDIEGGHFAERCQLFIIIALGESIVVTGATASAAGLSPPVVLCLIIAFVGTAALSLMYFGATAELARVRMTTCEDPGRLARDAYTYLHLPIIAGIIATAVGNDLLIAHPHEPLDGAGLAMVLGGPALYLLGESLFRRRMGGPAKVERVAFAALFVALIPVGDQLSALLLSAVVATLLTALAVWELLGRDDGTSYAEAGGPNQVVSAPASPASVPSPTQATYPSGRISTAAGAVTAPITGSSQTPSYPASIS